VVTYSIMNRTKEIGIRKVLGASKRRIVLLLSNEYISILLISYVFTLPVAWFISTKWIEDFAYKTEISWWVYILTAIILMITTAGTLGYQSIKAALSNPINQLRSE
jgi:putative ABC transport system permease protein